MLFRSAGKPVESSSPKRRGEGEFYLVLEDLKFRRTSRGLSFRIVDNIHFFSEGTIFVSCKYLTTCALIFWFRIIENQWLLIFHRTDFNFTVISQKIFADPILVLHHVLCFMLLPLSSILTI